MAEEWTWSNAQREQWREKRAERYENTREREENEKEEYAQLYAQLDAAENAANEKAAKRANRRTYFKADVGKFIMPEDAALVSLLYYVRDKSHAIQFSPVDYPPFDGIVAEKFTKDAFKEQYHRDYDEFEPLRHNIAAVRNYLYCTMFPDGSFDKSDEAKIPILKDIAEELGEALNHGRHSFSFNKTLSLAEANTPTYGATAIYKALLKIQNRRSLAHPLKFLLGHPNKNWGLPPIEQTPFGDLMRANTAGSYTGSIAETNKPGTGDMMAAISEEMDMHVRNFGQVENLRQPVVDESVDLAREILDKMKITLGPGMDDPWKGQNPEKVLDQTNAIAHLTNTFEQYMAFSVPRDSGLQADAAFLADARETVGKLSAIIKKEAADALASEGKTDSARKMAEEVSRMPNEWKTATPAALRGLLGKLETGIERSYQVSQAIQKAQTDAIRQTNTIHRTHNAHRHKHSEQQKASMDPRDLRAVAQVLASGQTQRVRSREKGSGERGKLDLSSSDFKMLGKLSEATGQDPAKLKKELEKSNGIPQQPSGGKSR